MRIRIIRTPFGFIDGIHVSALKEGSVYDLPATLATLLLVEGWAESEISDTQLSHGAAVPSGAAAGPRNRVA